MNFKEKQRKLEPTFLPWEYSQRNIRIKFFTFVKKHPRSTPAGFWKLIFRVKKLC